MSGRLIPSRLAALAGAVALLAAACSPSAVSETSSRQSDDDASVAAGDADSSGSSDSAGDATSAGVADGDTGGTGGDTVTGDGDAGDGADGPFEPAAIEWEEFNDAVDVGTLEVPVDYDDPAGPTFELFLARYRAIDSDNRVGSLLVNPGGPGFGGSDYAFFAAQVFDRPLLERFDIIGWDPRGTGESDPPIDCIDDYDPYFTDIDSTPETEEERTELVETAQDFARQCVANNADIIQHVGTNNSARDMDSIRRALGEETISYFGFSYGSELGATWATLFPETVRAAVLDGAADPEADALESSLQQLAGFEASLTKFLARCSADTECPLHNDGDAESAFEELMVSLDADPVIGETGRPRVNRDVATIAVIQAMYSESFWAALRTSLGAAADGDGSGLLALHDNYYQRASDGTYGNELEAFQAISCADTPERPTVDEVEAEQELFTEVAPRLVPEGSAGGFFCSFFPEAIEPRATVTGDGAGPIVVIGTTGDPATPFESTVRMSNILEDGRLVVVEADQHTGYGVNRCVIEVVNDYLIDLEPPADETECR
ncbi:MAG: alpha/beta hydrolase [Ilumatobacter sp.]|uniref:alpha/beta hydrolase n=1 Tax=Ilumatobacter sp. TaxID=1967498 RepID=UPI0026381F78|nr:alpha/beta hydrolase [Ilumatobacter sp.]MDJ0771736.1 alpha/beta hydrolase [Ilumatobacter sp.]